MSLKLIYLTMQLRPATKNLISQQCASKKNLPIFY